ncbi:MAG: DUF1553 domain-containing protein [Aquincola sp.]|nr:DUF1553 domain-containing protein [Aquincola sp.]
MCVRGSRRSTPTLAQGAPPTHPELLDWLAVELMDNSWSLKHLAKTIVMSAAYRQASHASPEKLAVDPENRLLARGARYRLASWMIRDGALAQDAVREVEGDDQIDAVDLTQLCHHALGGDFNRLERNRSILTKEK